MPVPEKQALKSCLDHCQVTLQDLQTIASAAQNQQAKTSLNEAVQSLNDCIQKCQTASSQVQ